MKCKYYILFFLHLTLVLGVSENCFSDEKMSQGTLAKLESAPQAEIYFKNSKAFIFSLVKSDQEFKIRDSIFVGPQSEAKLEFSKDYGGGIILLGPNTIVTLIQTGKANDIPTIEVKQGTVKVLKAPENKKEMKVIPSKDATHSSGETFVTKSADTNKLILITHESNAVVFNSSLESTEVKVSDEGNLKINPVGIPLRQKSEPAPPPVVFDLAKIQNLDSKPLQEFVLHTTEIPVQPPATENKPPVVAVKSKAKAKPKPQIKAAIVQVPAEQKIETTEPENKIVTIEPVIEAKPTVSKVENSILTSHWFVFAGLSNMNYTQTASPSINEQILTLRGSYRLSFSEVLDLGVSGEASAMPLTSSEGIKLRFFRSNINAGFTLPFVTSPWRLSVYPGMYFTTTQASGFIIGYSELHGVEFITLIERSLSSNSRLGLSLRVAPVLNSTSIEMGNREVGVGASYSFPPNLKKRYFSIQSDFTSLEVTFNTIQVSSKVICLGAAYNW
jgi:hypothetical protein